MVTEVTVLHLNDAEPPLPGSRPGSALVSCSVSLVDPMFDIRDGALKTAASGGPAYFVDDGARPALYGVKPWERP